MLTTRKRYKTTISFISPYFSALNVCYENIIPLTRDMFVRLCPRNERRAKPGMAQPSIQKFSIRKSV
jgi:hypothetical protein